MQWIAERATTVELILSVCTGAALLATAGVLNQRRATTNKRAFDWVCAQNNQVTWVKKARWVEDGNIITAAGISAGIDMSLYTIGRLFGAELRQKVAHRAEYISNNNSDYDPFG